MRRRRRFLAGAVALLTAASLACSREPESTEHAPARDVTVFAAASLREAFTSLAKKLEAAQPGAHVVLSFAGSQTLRAQIEQGAPADVFASADQRHMQALVAQKRVLEPRVFARNELVVVVSKAKQGALVALKSLPEAERIVLGGAEVPIGAYTTRVLDAAARDFGSDFRARVEAKVVSREPDVRQVLAKVSLGEADAGIVYRTDAMTANDRVSIVAIPSAYNVVAEYPVAIAASAPQPELARAFVELLSSAEGQRVLAGQGFLPPSAGAAPP
jgi:molybdate transport system substrate-binding protein